MYGSYRDAHFRYRFQRDRRWAAIQPPLSESQYGLAGRSHLNDSNFSRDQRQLQQKGTAETMSYAIQVVRRSFGTNQSMLGIQGQVSFRSGTRPSGSTSTIPMCGLGSMTH